MHETSYCKGHKYVTVVTNHNTNQVIWVGNAIGTILHIINKRVVKINRISFCRWSKMDSIDREMY